MKNESLPQSEAFFRECIRNLLIGLEILEIDDFMNFHLSPENCLELGKTYSECVKARLKIPQNTSEYSDEPCNPWSAKARNSEYSDEPCNPWSAKARKGE